RAWGRAIAVLLRRRPVDGQAACRRRRFTTILLLPAMARPRLDCPHRAEVGAHADKEPGMTRNPAVSSSSSRPGDVTAHAVEGELWHGTWEGDESEIRRVDPENGAVLDRLAMPAGTFVSGLEADGADLFYAGGGGSGTVRAVRRPKRGATLPANF